MSQPVQQVVGMQGQMVQGQIVQSQVVQPQIVSGGQVTTGTFAFIFHFIHRHSFQHLSHNFFLAIFFTIFFHFYTCYPSSTFLFYSQFHTIHIYISEISRIKINRIQNKVLRLYQTI